LPWFDYYSDNLVAVEGSKKLDGLKSVVEMGKKKPNSAVAIHCFRLEAAADLRSVLNR
jgi:hypothetical protein